MKKILILMSFIVCLLSCQNKSRSEAERILNDWIGKEIKFPDNLNFSIQGQSSSKFAINKSEYKIIMYVDSMGCTSCKLHLSEWKDYINYMDSIYSNNVQFLFYFFPKSGRDIYLTLRTERFTYPVCIDTLDVLNKMNHFPKDMQFQTLLLDKNNKVLAIGNPIINPSIKQLYQTIISGRKDQTLSYNQPMTTVLLSSLQIEMGNFSWEEEQIKEIIIVNSGNERLVINEVITSCGCTKVDFSKKPILPNDSIIMKVKYKAEHPEHFNKTVTVYCNAENSPLEVMIIGNAQ